MGLETTIAKVITVEAFMFLALSPLKQIATDQYYPGQLPQKEPENHRKSYMVICKNMKFMKVL